MHALFLFNYLTKKNIFSSISLVIVFLFYLYLLYLWLVRPTLHDLFSITYLLLHYSTIHGYVFLVLLSLVSSINPCMPCYCHCKYAAYKPCHVYMQISSRVVRICMWRYVNEHVVTYANEHLMMYVNEHLVSYANEYLMMYANEHLVT